MEATTSQINQAIAELNTRPLSPRQRYAAGLIAFGEFIDGYDLLVMGAAVILLRKQFGLTPQEVGLLGASTFMGAIVGLLVFGDLSDRVGRRSIFVINLFFFVVFALGSAFVTNVTWLFIMRFLVGVGVGMDIPTSTAYLAEIAPSQATRRRVGLTAEHDVAAGGVDLDAAGDSAGGVCSATRHGAGCSVLPPFRRC